MMWLNCHDLRKNGLDPDQIVTKSSGVVFLAGVKLLHVLFPNRFVPFVGI